MPCMKSLPTLLPPVRMTIHDSDHIRLFGHGGKAATSLTLEARDGIILERQ